MLKQGQTQARSALDVFQEDEVIQEGQGRDFGGDPEVG